MGSTAHSCAPSGETCLHQAAALGQRTICHYIVEAGASLMKTDQQVSRSAGPHPLSQTWAFVRREPGGQSACGDLKLFLNLRNLSQQGWGPYRSQREEPLPSPKPQRSSCLLQGDTPRQRAEKAQDTELAAYLENRQHYQMIQREDQETAV